MRALSLALASTVAYSAPSETGSDVVTVDAATTGDAATVIGDKPAKRLRKRAAPKPVAEAAPIAPQPEPEAPVADAEPATKPAPVARTIATIAASRTNFGSLSDRDLAYIAFFASFAKAASDGVVTVADIANSGRVPAYHGSAKPHDAGAINRLRKAGLIVLTDADGSAFRFTDAATTHKVYAQA